MSLTPDVRFAARMLIKRPGFTAGAVVSLAVGIAANVFVVSVVDALLLRPVPVEDYGSLVSLHARAEDGSRFHAFSYPTFRDIQEGSAALEGVVAYSHTSLAWSTGEDSDLATGVAVSGNYFSMLGLQPAAGRLFGPEEGWRPKSDAVVVLSHRLWRSRFGEDPAVVGRPIRVNGLPLTVIGVAPEGFRGLFHGLAPSLWVPLSMAEPLRLGPPLEARGEVWLELTGRLAPDATPAQARASLDALARRLRERYPDAAEPFGIEVLKASPVPGLAQRAVKTFLGVLFGLTGLMLLVACFNVAGMLLARATGRSREIAVRLALGSGRGRLLRQLLVEVLVLFLLAGAVAVALGLWLVELAPRLLAPVVAMLPVDVLLDLRLDLRVLGYALLVSLATGLVFGLAPVLQATRPDVVHELKGEAEGPRRFRLWKLLVAGQTAASVLLLVLAGLLVRGLHRSASIDPGFEPEGVHLLSLDLSHNLYSEAQGRAFYESLLRRAAALPGMAGVALADRVPLGTEYSSTGVAVPGVEPPEGDDLYPAGQSSVGGDYFRTMGIPLLAGRSFDAGDGAGARAVAVVSEAFARRFWPEGDAVGQVFYEGRVETGEAIQVVGVAGQVKHRSVGEEPRLYVYRPFEQRYREAMTLHVRIPGEPGAVLQGLREAVRDLNEAVPVVAAMPLSRYIRVATFPQRLAAGLTGFLGVVGLLLVGVGMYGLVAYSVTLRRLEMGVRLAVGARPVQVTVLVLRQGLVLSLAGAAVGLALSLVAGQALSSFLFGLSSTDPVTFGAVVAAVVGVSLLASYLPARSAARLDPARTLHGG